MYSFFYKSIAVLRIIIFINDTIFRKSLFLFLKALFPPFITSPFAIYITIKLCEILFHNKPNFSETIELVHLLCIVYQYDDSTVKRFPHIVEEGSISIDRTKRDGVDERGKRGRDATEYNDGEYVRRVRWR